MSDEVVYKIGTSWDLFVGGELIQKLYVYEVSINKRDDGRYEVKHYDADGSMITKVTLDAEDIENGPEEFPSLKEIESDLED